MLDKEIYVKNINYNITEEIDASEIEISDRIVDYLKMEDFDTFAKIDAITDTSTLDRPNSNTIYRLRLSFLPQMEGYGRCVLMPNVSNDMRNKGERKSILPIALSIPKDKIGASSHRIRISGKRKF